jgi:hypothetical protein
MVIGMISKDGEYVKLNQPVPTTNMQLEKWLQNLDTTLMNTIRKLALFAYQDMDMD